MSAESVYRLLNPRSVAVVGASESLLWVSSLVENLRKWDFPGEIHMVNPRREKAFGQVCYPSIADVPEQVDHALIVVRASLVPGVLRDCAAAGVHGATVIAAGFAEVGPEGASLAEEVGQICREHSIDLVGPNCYGFANFGSDTVLSRLWVEEPVKNDGAVSMVFQSGHICLMAYGKANQIGMDFRYAVSSGNELVTDANDYFDYFIDDPGTRVIGGTLERIPEPKRFEQIALRALEAGKPIVLCKMGRSDVGSRVTTSHTGSIAGVQEVVDAFLRELGVIVVDDLDELVATADLLAASGAPRGGRTLFLGGSGGAGGFFADLAEGTAIELVPLPEQTTQTVTKVTGLPADAVMNPLDLTAAGVATLAELLPALAADDSFDLIVALGDELRSLDVVGETVTDIFTSHMTAMGGIRAAGAWGTFFSVCDRGPSDWGLQLGKERGAKFIHGGVGVRALHNSIVYGTRREALIERLRWRAGRRSGDQPANDFQLSHDSVVLSEADAKAWLASANVPVTRDIAVKSVGQAVEAARSIGYPVVLKLDSADVAHKSEIGGVVVGVSSDEEVATEFEAILDRARQAHPALVFDSVLVCEQIDDAVELIVGALIDPAIGPMVLVGLGGIYVEILKDTALALPPFDRARAGELLRSLQSWPILAGTRGKAGVDIDALETALVAFGDLVDRSASRIVELDINPLFAMESGVRVGDALVAMTGGRS